MSKTKSILLTTSIALIVALVAVFVGSYYLRATSTELATRDINVNEIGMLSYEEKYEKLVANYTNFETTTNGNNATINFALNKTTQINYLSANNANNLEFCSQIDYEEGTILITGNEVTNNGEIVSSYSENTSIFYDEENDIPYIILEDGTKLDLLQEFAESNYEECIAITLFWGIAALIGLATITAVVAPDISQGSTSNGMDIIDTQQESILNDVINGIVDTVGGWFNSIKLAFGAITATKLHQSLTLTTHAIESVAKKVEKGDSNDNIYLLLNSFVPNSHLTTSYGLTDIRNAANWIKKGGSVWTLFKVNARNAVKTAGYQAGAKNSLTKKYEVNLTEWHEQDYFLSFEHYHTLKKQGQKYVRVNQTCHVCFGFPR